MARHLYAGDTRVLVSSERLGDLRPISLDCSGSAGILAMTLGQPGSAAVSAVDLYVLEDNARESRPESNSEPQ